MIANDSFLLGTRVSRILSTTTTRAKRGAPANSHGKRDILTPQQRHNELTHTSSTHLRMTSITMNNHTMRPVMARHSSSSSSGEGVSYYAHAVAIFVLYILWRFPASAAAKSNKNLPGFVVNRRLHVRDQKTKSTEESALSEREKAIDEVMTHDEAVADLFPNATSEERRRFLVARLGNLEAAKSQLGTYLEWREKHDAIEKDLNLNEAETDEDDWNIAAAVALVSCEEERQDDIRLPRIARVYTLEESAVCDRDGRRVLHVMPGQINVELAKPSTYAVALALYIDRKLDRASLECLTVALDVRGGRGWPNVPPLRQLPFIQTVIKLLLTMFPERLHRCLLFPVPRAARWIWNIVKAWIDPLTSSKVQLLAGAAKIVSEPPFAAMDEFLEPHVAKFFESQRHASFMAEASEETC